MLADIFKTVLNSFILFFLENNIKYRLIVKFQPFVGPL